MLTCLSDQTRRARKLHRCFWCRDQIQIGTTYRHVVMADSGDISTTKEHIHCGQRVAVYARANGIEDDYDYGAIEWFYVIEWESEQAQSPSVKAGGE